MQIKNITGNKKSIPLIILKVFFLLSSLWYVGRELVSRGSVMSSSTLPERFWVFVVGCIFLMILNWGLEAYRWKISVQPFEKLSFQQSYKVVLAGLAMNLLIPFTVGDALTRILSLKNKYQGTSAMMLNRVIMLLITLAYGLYSLDTYFQNFWSFSNFIWASVLVGGFLVLLFFRRRLSKLLTYYNELSPKLILSILFVSILRYLVFVFQFFILIKLFFPELPNELAISGIGWIFLARSVLPSFLGGIGIREASGLFFFSEVLADPTQILMPIFIIWIINTMLPSLVGLVSVWNFRFKIAGWSFLSRG